MLFIGFATIFARFSDIVGRRPVVFIAFTIFTTFSLACGLARTLIQLIIFRALQGIGGSGLYAMTMVVFPEITPPNLLVTMAAVYGATISVAGKSTFLSSKPLSQFIGVLGPILGGVITKYSSWRWIFLMK
jgi:MFS family permease